MNTPDFERILNEHQPQYAQAEPFPHAVIDNFLPLDTANRIVDLFPKPGDIDWTRFADTTGHKLASSNVDQLPQELRNIFSMLNSATMLSFLENLTGIEGLIPDPWYEGGGLHQITRGGFLKVHADFNYHNRLKLDRRINLLLYLNPSWQDSYGGCLELWNRDMTGKVREVLPLHNRCVIFNTTDDAYHGHPHPLQCPEGMTRKSLALYYYTNGRPDSEKADAHTTIYRDTPAEAALRKSLRFRCQSGLSSVLETAASVAYQPSKWLRKLADKLKPQT